MVRTGHNPPAPPEFGLSGLQRESELVVTIIRFALIALAALAPQYAGITSADVVLAMRASVLFAFVYNSLLLIMMLMRVRLHGIRHIMLALDILLTGVWVYYTWSIGPGQVGSPLFPFFYVVVITGALWFSLRGAFLTAGVIALLYLFTVYQQSGHDPMELIQALYWHIVYLFLVALAAGYLAETYRREREQWARTRERLIETQARTRVEQEERRQLIPTETPVISGLDIGARWRPAFAEGGDFYDVFRLSERLAAIIIADVSGKEYSSAVKLPFFKGAFLAAVQALQEPDPGRVLSHLNAIVYPALQPDMFISACVAILDIESGRLIYANGGQDPPMLARHGGAEVLQLETGGLVLGVDRQADYPTEAVRLTPGDTLCFYTDGIIEARDPAGEFFDYDGLKSVLQTASAEEKDAAANIEAIFGAVARFTRGGPRRDDMSVVVVRYQPE